MNKKHMYIPLFYEASNNEEAALIFVVYTKQVTIIIILK